MTPRRPDHPDSWMISQAILDTDAMASHAAPGDAGNPTPDIVGRYVDLDSLMYAAEQRAVRLAGPNNQPLRTALASTWMDAFVAGVKFQHLKTTGAQTFTDPDEKSGPDARS